MSNKKIQEPNVDYILRLAENITRPLEMLFFLLPGFPIYSVIPAVECLRVANQNTNENLFRWIIVINFGSSIDKIGFKMTDE
jgi:transcriptional regulator GlxA family with amidase domain